MSKQNIPNKEDEKLIKAHINNNYSIAYHALKAARIYNFSVGDIIIKNSVEEEYDDIKDDWTGKYKYNPVPISKTNNSPRKFKVVAIDEFGIPWIRQINSTNGKLGDSIESLAEFNIENWRFTPDETQAESILLGDEDNFDPLAIAKAKRKAVTAVRKANKKKMFTSTFSSQWGEKLSSLKRGQELWFRKNKRYMGDGGTFFRDKEELEETRIRVLSVKKLTTIKEIDNSDAFDRSSCIEEAKIMVRNREEVVVVKYIGKDYNGNWHSASNAEFVHNVNSQYYNELDKMIMYTEEPEVASE